MLASSGERIPPWGVPVIVSLLHLILGEDAGLEERLHQRPGHACLRLWLAPGP